MPITHPYGDLSHGAWLRGNLHTHTTKSDGNAAPQTVIDDYARRGYGFLALSDHDIFIGHDEYKQLESRGLILIPGNEISANGPHVQHIGGDRRIEPFGLRQDVFNAITAASGFSVVNHPNWGREYNHATIAQMREWVGYIGLEIYNGVISRLPGTPYAAEKWDTLLSEGRRLWAFANDDMHDPTQDIELGWNVAYVKDNTPAGVMDALVSGRFYPSTGVVINAITVTGNTMRIETQNASRIVANTDFGRRIATSNTSSIEVQAPQGVKYVRFTCWGEGEKFAWTQPFWVS